ncbi:MAG: hypothetical protein Kow00128_16250 [Deltaproteobacteria bacterium]
MRRRTALFLVLLLTAWQAVAGANSPVKGESQVGKPSPDFRVTDVEGREYTLEGLLAEGKVVVVNFWGIRCSACIEEMPSLNMLCRKYRDRIVVLGVNADGVDGATLKELMKDSGISAEFEIIPDPEFRMIEVFNLIAAPLTIVVDTKGIVRFRHEDYKPGDEKALEQAILDALPEPPTKGRSAGIR